MKTKDLKIGDLIKLKGYNLSELALRHGHHCRNGIETDFAIIVYNNSSQKNRLIKFYINKKFGYRWYSHEDENNINNIFFEKL